MPKFIVRKILQLAFECEAENEQEAEELCADEDDSEFTMEDCQYEVTLVE